VAKERERQQELSSALEVLEDQRRRIEAL
jgi:hypothetical protein